MKPLSEQHADLVVSAIQAAQQAGDLPAFDIPEVPINPSKRIEQGDFASPVAMALARVAKMKPLDIANAIVAHLPAADFIESAEVSPPGFINFRLSKLWLIDQINVLIEQGDTFGNLDIGHGKRAQVEFVSANPTGPLHVGRSRGAIVGDAVARILEAAGFEVQREYYFNNAGVQMKNLGESLRVRYLEALGQPVEIPDESASWFYQGEYLKDIAQQLIEEQGDALLDADWQPFKVYAEAAMFKVIKETLARVDIHHDAFFNENSLFENNAIWDVLDALDKGGYIYKSPVREGESEDVIEKNKDLAPATWFRSTRFGDSEDRVLVKSDGAPTYTLPDIAYHKNKIERGFDLLVNVLGADHYTQHQVVKYGIQALGLDASKINVILIQMVRMVRDGKEVKISTRRGTYETLDDLIDATSADAVRYTLAARNPNSQMDFDMDLAIRRSNDNPVYYIQYAHVRCAGILREAQTRGFSDDGADLSLLDEEALRFMRKCLELPDQIRFAAETLSPHTIPHFALEIANQFHPMYDRVRVFGEGVDPELAKARLRFYRAVQAMFKRMLKLMGMSAPEFM
ncbi:MAG: arginine--tRNA ligase [Phototrophicales bacterium]|nr:MAG: arginine--tRNA ligase [Phototrophicales bacterium]RMG75609.1 MAG: arginine--tRNA ligase [Chloroflexota bacterium]